MEQKHIKVAGILLVVIIIGMFVFAYLKKNELAESEPVEPVVTTDTEDSYAGIDRIDAKHFYVNGTHTLAGEILMPTPCDLLNWTTRVAESMPEQVTVDFDVVNNAETCAQVVTPQRFKVSFEASEGASINATLEGRHVELNLLPPLPGETPDDFELFIKG